MTDTTTTTTSTEGGGKAPAKVTVEESATTTTKVELPKGAIARESAREGEEDGEDHTPTEEMNKLVHFNALEPSHVGTIKDVSAANKLIQRKYAPKDFHWSKSAEIHRLRRKQIVQAHPEIVAVQGADNRQAVFATFTVLVQFAMCFLVRNWSWPSVILATWLISGFMEHSIVMGGHELSHDMFFKTRFYNRLFSLFLNLPVGVAMMATFRRYHLDHHSSQGVPKVDVDLPTRFEANLFQHKFGKFVWAFFQPFFYALRPMVVHPLPMSLYELTNWLVQLPFDILVVKCLGWKSFFYLIGGLFMGLSIFNPISGHFIAEHYEFVYGQETYSYYGPLNFIVYNVGLHNEHHDFPNVAGFNLWKVKAIAPEWYDIPSYTSWTKVLYQFITGDNMNLYCRVMRKHA
ncbi:membrane fatty acid desaturase, putative [Perkinsus marinus ATCC 50983]|uniref:Membrane fatty acid desaturase, putative n=1 Tax=Perkinsus marinus (strain ATCC 50983 / TXsc) TaxID=423536 RepID=C5LJG4_PERM5|nr:membrane fatty acid desaturase, putative [Perkinsus marinus ATCC 50983]EER03093.1 membrane fatty acid desaturase, putative [Perkinsus marinus ATCC 50983]|eukprot:XP_002771277.1 membrane fatty acid desaturase, putative [Perkinsus marinus ATCC 50983]